MTTTFQPVNRLLVAADLEAFPAELPSGPIDYELDDGRLVLTAPFTCDHSTARTNIAARLMLDGQFKGHGKAYGRVAIVLWRDPDRVVTPSAAFIANKSLPIRTSPEDYLETIPELVVEIRSKNDLLAYMRRKVEHYLKAGVEVVWLADSAVKTITIHAPGVEPIIRGAEDTLELLDLIPGFSLPVADIFRE